jgi:predicted dehydrogenase
MKPINRRSFAAAALSPALLLHASPGDAVHLAVAGVRGRGKDHIRSFSRVPGVVIDTICEVDERLWAPIGKMVEELTGRRPRFEADLRRVLERPEIDAVTLATPNHWHALGAIWACQAGKDVYVEKPVSHSIGEGRKIVQAALRYKRIVGAGTQHRSGPAVGQAIEFLRSGRLGKLYMARCPVFRAREPIAATPESPVPAGVHYDLWLGPAPWLPFRQSRFHYNWHWHWATGNGETGNNGPHYADIARWGLGKSEHPVRTISSGGLNGVTSDQETPNTQLSILEYADGTRLQLDVRGHYTYGEDALRMGIFFFGSEGWMRCSTTSWATFFGRRNEPGPTAADAPGTEQSHLHAANFIAALRSRDASRLAAPILDGHLSTSLCHLGNLAYRTGRTLRFEPATETFPGDPEASALLSRAGRAPFTIPEQV